MAIVNEVSGYQRLLQLGDGPILEHDAPDDRSGARYLASGDLVLATEIALVTGRPLLLRGSAGSGKSSWAPYVARNLGWSYYETIMTSDSETTDLYYEFDALRRLHQAHIGKETDDLAPWRYTKPATLWLAFDFPKARALWQQRQRDEKELDGWGRNTNRDVSRAVVLIDELDKADPNLPNALLDTIALRKFPVEPLEEEVFKQKPKSSGATYRDGTKAAAQQENINQMADLLMVFTTNEERDLPDAFLRRCVVHQLPNPDAERLERIAWLRRFPDGREVKTDNEVAQEKQTIALFASVTVKAREQAEARNTRGPSAAEFLDLVAAWDRFGRNLQGEALVQALQTVFQKSAEQAIDVVEALRAAREAKPV